MLVTTHFKVQKSTFEQFSSTQLYFLGKYALDAGMRKYTQALDIKAETTTTTTTTKVLIIVTLHKVAGALYISDLKTMAVVRSQLYDS